MHIKNLITILLVATASTMVAIGCGGDGTETTTSSGGRTSGSGGAGGAGGGGTGGQGGELPPDLGKSSHDFVNAGYTVTSPGHKMVFTLGQSSPVQNTVSSPGYQLRGGLIGATGGK